MTKGPPMTPADLDALEALLAAMTPGPWDGPVAEDCDPVDDPRTMFVYHLARLGQASAARIAEMEGDLRVLRLELEHEREYASDRREALLRCDRELSDVKADRDAAIARAVAAEERCRELSADRDDVTRRCEAAEARPVVPLGGLTGTEEAAQARLDVALRVLRAAADETHNDARPSCESAAYGSGCPGADAESVAFWRAAMGVVEVLADLGATERPEPSEAEQIAALRREIDDLRETRIARCLVAEAQRDALLAELRLLGIEHGTDYRAWCEAIRSGAWRAERPEVTVEAVEALRVAERVDHVVLVAEWWRDSRIADPVERERVGGPDERVADRAMLDAVDALRVARKAP